MEDLGFKKDRYVFVSISPIVAIEDDSQSNKNKQITLFFDELNTYNVLIKDLIKCPINENERNIALNIAYYIINNEDLLRRINEKKDLPILKLSKLTKLRPNYLEKCRDYIIAYYIILSNPNYKCMQDYFKIKLREENKILSISNKNEKIHKGLVIKSFRKCAYILTSKGEFFKIKTSDKVNIGESAEGKEKRFLGNYKIQISILLVILMIIGSGIVIQYRTTQSIIVINTTSSIKIHVNKFNKVIYAYSATDKGSDLLNNIDVENKDVDEVISQTLEYAAKNQMIDFSKKVLVTVTGQPLKHGSLTKTDKIVSENSIPIIINNGGNQLNLPKYLTEDETKK